MKYRILFKSIEAFCDAVIFDNSELLAVSIVGRQNPVKAILAGLTSGKYVSIQDNSKSVYETIKRPKRTCSFKTTPIGDDLFQGVFFDKENKGLITTEKGFFNTVDSLFDIPVHEDWSAFLWEKGLETGNIRKLSIISENEMEDHFFIELCQETLLDIIQQNIHDLTALTSQ